MLNGLLEFATVDVASAIDVHCSPQLFYTKIFGLDAFTNLVENLLDLLLVSGNFFLGQLLLQIATFILAYDSHFGYDVDE